MDVAQPETPDVQLPATEVGEAVDAPGVVPEHEVVLVAGGASGAWGF